MRDLIYEKIKKDILTCTYEPGQKLSEAILSKSFGASRSLIREVLISLEFENLIVVVPKIGSFVAPISFDYLSQALFVRRSLEVANLRDLVFPMLSSHLELLQLEVERTEILLNLNQYADVINSTNEFHKMLFLFNGRVNIWDYIKIFNNSVQVLHQVEKLDQELRSHKLHEQHKELIQRLRDSDLDSAIDLMIDHVNIDFNDMHIIAREPFKNSQSL
jgi:GntR family transcriptional regulator, rspAB operon transcriptional repressor